MPTPKKVSKTIKSAISLAKRHRHADQKKRRLFPYDQVAKMWEQGKTIAVIAHTIDRVDKDTRTAAEIATGVPADPYHSLRNFLCRMHKGYTDKNGNIIKLPHRISKSTLRLSREAGSLAWEQEPQPKKKKTATAAVA